MTQKDIKCMPVLTLLEVIGGKWKPVILYLVSQKTWRFGELTREIPGITQKMLTQQLRELEEDGLVKRKVFPVVPPHVEYSITEYGKTLNPILKSMWEWGSAHKKRKQANAAAQKQTA